jgi:peptidyl-prolyl cis-trans isomerase C
MTPRRRPAAAFAVVAAGAVTCLGACREAPPPPSPDVVAEIEGEPVRYEQFEAYVERALGEPGDSLGSDVLSQLFDQFVEERLLARLAVERGLLPAGAAAGRAGRRRAVDLLLAAAGDADGAAATSPGALRAWYDAHRDRFRRPARVRLRQLLVEDRGRAEQAFEEIRAGAPFAAVAARLADDPAVAATGGSLGELSREDVPPAFAEVIFALAPGEVSPVVEADYGFHLFQVTETLPAEVLPFEAVRDEVEQSVRREAADRRLRELAEEARRRYDVSVWDRNLPFNYRGVHLAEAG